ncbi:uncharacterized protein LOC133518568 [Cydia pomonella]|uniref:uncharacterized protein LOC133518568 n=1 Tax=Cydia pomonella TaxID=82600 RepID=UPI002ADE5AB0|nr:uncharacterized protein LOC133518568 [Cydia pomonella]
MDSILPPPPPFLFVNSLENVTTGNLSKEWEKWKNSFLIYYEACELSKKDKKVQLSILLHIIGEQCREVHEQFDKASITTYSELLDKFDSFFLPQKNLTIERHRFFTRDQKEGESIEQYSFELKKLASSCEFKDLMETLIRDRLICGIKDHAIRERLLREPDLTLKKSLDICNVAQISKVQAGAIKKESVEHHAYAVQRDYFGHQGVVRETACEENSDISDVNRVVMDTGAHGRVLYTYSHESYRSYERGFEAPTVAQQSQATDEQSGTTAVAQPHQFVGARVVAPVGAHAVAPVSARRRISRCSPVEDQRRRGERRSRRQSSRRSRCRRMRNQRTLSRDSGTLQSHVIGCSGAVEAPPA